MNFKQILENNVYKNVLTKYKKATKEQQKEMRTKLASSIETLQALYGAMLNEMK